MSDQGIISLTNLGLNLVIARFLSGDIFGQYTLTFSIVYFFYGVIQNSLTLIPLIIFGGKIEDYQKQLLFTGRFFFIIS